MVKYDFSSDYYSHLQISSGGEGAWMNVIIHDNDPVTGSPLKGFDAAPGSGRKAVETTAQQPILGKFLCFCAQPAAPGTYSGGLKGGKFAGWPTWERWIKGDITNPSRNYKMEIQYIVGNKVNGLNKPEPPQEEHLILTFMDDNDNPVPLVNGQQHYVVGDAGTWNSGATTEVDGQVVSDWKSSNVDVPLQATKFELRVDVIVPAQAVTNQDASADLGSDTNPVDGKSDAFAMDSYAIKRISFLQAADAAAAADICFPAGTPVTTDQGAIAIEKLIPGTHTIKDQPILGISQTKSSDNHLLCFEKHALGHNIPTQQTIVSREHCILYKGKNETSMHLYALCSYPKNEIYRRNLVQCST